MAEKKYVIDNAELMAEWNWEKNNKLNFDPKTLTLGSNKKVWWQCSSGHSFYKSIGKMHKNHSCPICSGHKTVTGVNDFATCYPEIAKEWHPTKNGDVLPTDISKKNGRKGAQLFLRSFCAVRYIPGIKRVGIIETPSYTEAKQSSLVGELKRTPDILMNRANSYE